MRRADYPEALERAAAPALAAVERAERRAPKRLKPLFAAMRETVFDPELKLTQIARAAGCEDDALIAELRREIGPPWRFLRDVRLEIAARLLLETPMPIGDVGRRLGYTSIPTFRTLLPGFLGMSAAQYRRRAPRILERGGTPPEGAETEDYWQRMLTGELSDEEARDLDAYLARLVPGEERPPDADAERHGRVRAALADGFVDALKHMADVAERRRFVREAVSFPDATFFERLSRQGREAGAGDQNLGVEWALLAVDSLAAGDLLERVPELAALGRTRLALARWRAGDPAGAEKDLEEADRDRGPGGRHSNGPRRDERDVPAAWRAELGRVAAAFDWHRGRRRRALEVAERMVTPHREIASPDLAKALRLRAELRAACADLDVADRREQLEQLRDALDDVDEARRLEGRSEKDAPDGLRPRVVALLGAGADPDPDDAARVLKQVEWARRSSRALELAL